MRKECTKPNDVGLQMETWVQVAGGPIRLNTEVGQMPVGFDSRALAERWWTTDPIGRDGCGFPMNERELRFGLDHGSGVMGESEGAGGVELDG
ncbi:hypothetical protein V6N11_056176 [Hibiscus sabdariffa]|uniref:Uncharacterized protein n=1 Tax=Hibiscus sabdariffa TaxID=183260 RepID=A0ABR2T320_9ROSI